MNIITKSFDYPSINLAEFDKKIENIKRSYPSWRELSAPYLKLYGITYENKDKTIFRLQPPPLYIQCIIKLRKLGLKADPKIFESVSPELAHCLTLIRDTKLTLLIFSGYHEYQHILSVNYFGKRIDYMWKDDNF
jgi:hypothetical protein